jgi:hypothetical protein
MKKISIIILFFFSIKSLAIHKDLYFSEKYGNVKTSIKTSFHNYGSTSRVEIIGKLAQKLCQKLTYRDTILVEFRHDTTNFYDKMIMVENGNSETNFLICNNIENIQSQQEKSHAQNIGNKAICIRLIDTDIDIIKTLKIIEYCILNKFINEKINLNCKSTFHFDNGETIDIQYLGMPNEMINKITNSDNSIILEHILEEGVTFGNDTNIKITYKNKNYHFETKNLEYETKTLSYLIFFKNSLIIFPNNDSFVYLNQKHTEIKTHYSSIPGSYSYLTNTLDIYGSYKLIENNNIMLFKYNSRKRIIFSMDNNEIVEIRE